MSDAAQKMRDRLNAKKANYAQTFTSEQELLQIKSWIPLPLFFRQSTGGEGFPCGHITQIVGEPDSGKTTLMMIGMVECQKAGGVAYLIDSEHKFSMSRFKLMGGTPEDVIVIQVDSLEDAWDAIKDVAAIIEEMRGDGFDKPIMLCWDSIAASVPKKIHDEEEAGNAHVSLEAKLNNKNVRKLRSVIKRTEIACVFINHYYSTMPAPGKPPKDVIKGGEEITFMSTMVVKTRKGAKIERGIKGETQQIGRVTKFQILKGHFHGRTLEKDVFVIDRGFLETKEELDEYKKTLRGEF